MRNTSESAMDERGLRDIERWKDKIEVRLDNRQVFFLFFGSALVACLLFILGVIVGKRLESRGRAMAPEIEDPLALLDKVATSPRPTSAVPGPALPKALLGTPAPAAKPSATPAKVTAPVSAAKPSPPAPPPAETHPLPAKPATPAPKAAVPATKAVALAPKTDTPPTPAPSAAKKTVAAPAIAPAAANANAAAKTKGRFTLQLGAFPDRAEAEAFAKRFAAQSSYVVPSEIPGKGTWFRVRVGDYATAKDAIAAKSNFEKQHGVIAYVVGPR